MIDARTLRAIGYKNIKYSNGNSWETGNIDYNPSRINKLHDFNFDKINKKNKRNYRRKRQTREQVWLSNVRGVEPAPEPKLAESLSTSALNTKGIYVPQYISARKQNVLRRKFLDQQHEKFRYRTKMPDYNSESQYYNEVYYNFNDTPNYIQDNMAYLDENSRHGSYFSNYK